MVKNVLSSNETCIFFYPFKALLQIQKFSHLKTFYEQGRFIDALSFHHSLRSSRDALIISKDFAN